MKITLAMVASVDGKTTKGNTPNTYHFSSKEDQKHFQSLLDAHNLIIMGRHTYEAAKDYMVHKSGRLRVVITNNPEQYTKDVIPEMLVFTNARPQKLITQLHQQGFTQALLVGGTTTNTAFFKANLINEIYLTLEPTLFGNGKNLLETIEEPITLKLMETKKLNKKGTLLLHYSVFS
jgi:dihydrofolate reductase